MKADDIEILYKDEHFIIVNKMAEELTVPGRGADKQECLMSRAARFFGEVFNVHRLDQPTSGLVIIALTKKAQRELSIMFIERKIYKEYIAVVEGIILEDSGIADFPVRGDMDNRPVQIVDYKQGKKAVTVWEVLSRGENSTRVLLKPETGRTHQLRIHLKTMGFPIEGDRLYNDNFPDDLMGELKLHARSLEFTHPFTGIQISVVKEPRF
ncbi:MAG: RluA family pseudouridine synthase [Proteobacteria bacterium]|nr:RluA family pseudouridine synthase [Pseudomonadota bacterium]